MSETTEIKQIIQAASQMITDRVNDLIYKDPHTWSERPCSTCNVITALTRKEFGCIRYRIERSKIVR